MKKIKKALEQKQEVLKAEGADTWAPYFFELPRDDKKTLIFRASHKFLEGSGKVDGVVATFAVRFLQGLIAHQEDSVGTDEEIKSFSDMRAWCDYDKIYQNYKKKKFSQSAKGFFRDALDLQSEFVFFNDENTLEKERHNLTVKLQLKKHKQMNQLIMDNAIARIGALEEMLTPQREKYLMELNLAINSKNQTTATLKV